MDNILSNIAEQNLVTGILVIIVIYQTREIDFWKNKHSQRCQDEESRIQSLKEFMQHIITDIKEIKNAGDN